MISRALWGLIFIISSAATADRSTLVQRCRYWLDIMSSEGVPAALELEKPEHASKREFLEEILFAVARQRLLVGQFRQYRDLKVDTDSATFSGFRDGRDPRSMTPSERAASGDITIRWQSDITEPQLEIDDMGNRTLRLPQNFRVGHEKRNLEGIVKSLLIGHTLHPYTASEKAREERYALGEAPFFLKPVQEDGMKAVRGAIHKNQDAFLYVAPTGVGKTEVLKEMLKTQIRKNLQSKPPKLHIVTAHMTTLVKQLKDAVDETFQNDRGEKRPRVIDAKEFEGQPIEWLIKEIESSEVPIILVTSSEAIQTKLQDAVKYDGRIEALKKHVATLAIDEAHHAGSEQFSKIISDLHKVNQKKKGRMFLYGTTATPFHLEKKDLVSDLFKDKDFWAYLDSPYLYDKRLKEERESGYDLDAILQQLEIAGYRGELHPFKVRMLNPNKNGGYFEKGGSGYRIKKDKIPELLDENHLGPALRAHQKKFITVGSIAEAKELAEAIQKTMPDQRVAALHSQDPNAEKIIEAFNRGEYDVLVTVKMIDEGYNLPDLSLYIDLTRHTGPRQLIQRIGRVTRLKEGKVEPAEIITFQEISDLKIARVLKRLQEIGTHTPTFGGGGGGGGGGKRKTGSVIDYTPQELEEISFWKRANQESKDADEEIRSTLEFLATKLTYARNLDPFDVNTYSRSDAQFRNLYNTLSQAMDDHRAKALAPSLERALHFPKPNWNKAVEWVEQFRKERQERLSIYENKEDTQEFFYEFIKKYGRVPGKDANGADVEKYTSQEEKDLISALKRWNLLGNPEVAKEMLKHVVPSNEAIFRAMGVHLASHPELSNEYWLKRKASDTRSSKTDPGLAPSPLELTAQKVADSVIPVFRRHIDAIKGGASAGDPGFQDRVIRLGTSWVRYKSLLRQNEQLKESGLTFIGNRHKYDLNAREIKALEFDILSYRNLELLVELKTGRSGERPVRRAVRPTQSETLDRIKALYEINFPALAP